jgi:hypothetical protein
MSERLTWDNLKPRIKEALDADDADHSFTCECGLRIRDSRYEAHVCPESAGLVRPGEEPTT